MKFRFETLLRLRKNQENLLQRDMGMINAHRLSQQERLESLDQITGQCRDLYNRNLQQSPDLRMLTLYDSFFKSSRINHAQQEKIISEVDQRAEAKREELAEAMRKRRTIEILKDRELLEQKKEKRKREVAFFDEVAASRFRRETL